MKLVETKCAACKSSIFVYEDFLREDMYCTLHCMESANSGNVMVKESAALISANMA